MFSHEISSLLSLRIFRQGAINYLKGCFLDGNRDSFTAAKSVVISSSPSQSRKRAVFFSRFLVHQMSSANSAFSDAPSNSNFTGALSIRTQPILQPGAGPSAIPSANEFLFHLPAESQALSDAIGDAVIVYSTQDERTRFVYSNESNSIQRFVVEILWDGSLLLTEAARTLTNTMASLRQDVGADGNLFRKLVLPLLRNHIY